MEEKIKEIFDKYGAVLGYIFGSHVRSTAGPLSDIDVAVAFPHSIDFNKEEKKENKIKYEIQDLFKVNRVDVINLRKNRNIALGYKILFEGKALLVQDYHLKRRLESKYLHDFEDTQYLRDAQFRILREKIHVAN